MSSSHAGISVEDLLEHIKVFVDLLVLASGFLSSGLPASWDVENTKKAVEWGLFFEEVVDRLGRSDEYKDSVDELDAAISGLVSSSLMPQGLTDLGSKTLSRARNLVLERFLGRQPLRNAHLLSLLTAVVEMDMQSNTGIGNLGFDKYVSDFMAFMGSLNIAIESPSVGTELLKMQASVAGINAVIQGMSAVAKIITRGNVLESVNIPSEWPLSCGTSRRDEETPEIMFSNKWRSKCLSYILDNRTIKLLSGAKLIFDAPMVQWMRVFEPLKHSTDAHYDNLLEIMEISLLGFTSRRWNLLIEHIMSSSCHPFPISKMYIDIHQQFQGRSEPLLFLEETMNDKEKEILQYVTQLLVSEPKKLWELPPVLIATIPTSSVLFGVYLRELEGQLHGSSCSLRYCNCIQENREHKDCEVAERINCLHSLHVQGCMFPSPAS